MTTKAYIVRSIVPKRPVSSAINLAFRTNSQSVNKSFRRSIYCRPAVNSEYEMSAVYSGGMFNSRLWPVVLYTQSGTRQRKSEKPVPYLVDPRRAIPSNRTVKPGPRGLTGPSRAMPGQGGWWTARVRRVVISYRSWRPSVVEPLKRGTWT